MSLGFRIDTTGCTGCKACQVACKDKHALPEGRLWRRVVEVQGGSWTDRDGTWIDGTWTWFVSLSCMHCAEPICVEVCPTKAMQKREDGIVFVDPDRCLGCGYCQWACPYAAPQLDEAEGVMTKCDLCRDRLAKGRPPACVEACPMRVLTLVEVGDEDAEDARSTYPLPPAGLTDPRTVLIPHPDVHKAANSGSRIANGEEL